MQCLTQQKISFEPKKFASSSICGLVLTMLLVPFLSHDKIYKTVDEDGNVSYSDVAPADLETRAESTIELEINNTYNAKDASPAPTNNSGNGSGGAGSIVSTGNTPVSGAESAGYQNITISAPAPDANLRSNSGDVSLSISLQPSLRPGDQVRFFLDGKPVGTVNGTSLALTNIDRGTHTLAAVVLDSAGKPRISSNTTSFTIQRFAPKPRISN